MSAAISVTIAVVVTVASELGDPYADLPVYVFDGETYTGFSGTSDPNGQVSFTLPIGDYRFRADVNGVQFWSGEINHCTVPDCTSAQVTVTKPVSVSVVDTDGVAVEGLNVYAFDGSTYTGFSGTTDASGEVSFRLPAGDYRFRSVATCSSLVSCWPTSDRVKASAPRYSMSNCSLTCTLLSPYRPEAPFPSTMYG